MRLVVCDDHRMFADALVALLAGRGHEAYACDTPVVAQELTERLSPDACLLDYRFGREVLGESAVRGIGAASPGVVVLVLTAMADHALITRVRSWGAHGVVGKTRGVDDVLAAVDVARRGRFADHASLPQERRPADHARLVASALAPREREVLACLAAGMPAVAIAETLGMSVGTARSHIQRVLTKLGVHSRVAAVAFAVEHDLA